MINICKIRVFLIKYNKIKQVSAQNTYIKKRKHTHKEKKRRKLKITSMREGWQLTYRK